MDRTLFLILFLLHHLLRLDATRSCNVSSFSHSLNGTQCFGLVQVDGISSYSECETNCCSYSSCQMFEWCSSSNPACGSYAGTCWTGQADLTKCVPSAEWQGAYRTLPPPPPRLPQRFLRPYTQSSTLPLAVLDLADETRGSATWTIQVDNEPVRSVYVPSGGYNSDQQDLPFIDSIEVNTAANYTREFTVPLNFGGDEKVVVLHLAFGAVNHGAEVYIAPINATSNITLAGAHYGPHMAFDVDASAAGVVPGGSYLLSVVSRPLPFFNGDVASGFRYAETWSNPSDGWSSRQCAGICKYVRLVALPRLRVDELVVRGNISLAIANVDVVIRNDGAVDVEEGEAQLTSLSLISWNAIFGLGTHTSGWPYPILESVSLPVIAARSEASLTFSINWGSLPPSSFWWPNRPFNESYYSQLHILNATLSLTGVPVSFASQRFGFVEHKESTTFFYTINGIRINYLSDATPENGMSFYDCFANEAAFGSQGGARESWRRYMRLGITANRIHQSTPTQDMLNAADEVGFLLKPESPLRGCPGYEPCNSSSPLLRQSVDELIHWSRMHPSVFAFSLENEGSDNGLNADLVDAATLAGVNVPLTTEGSGGSTVVVGPITGGHAVNLLHYSVPQEGFRGFPPRGVGECAWCVKDGIEEFSSLALAGRLDDVAYYAGWDMLNYWPNFFQGMNASLHAWHQEPCNGTDRTDGVDGWGSPLILWIQAAFDPFLVADVVTTASNPSFTPQWPTRVDKYTFTSGSEYNITRSVALFNDVLADVYEPWDDEKSSILSLLWSAHWDDSSTPSIASGSIIDIPVPPGFHSTVNVSLPIPDPGPIGGRQLFFSFSSIRGGESSNPSIYFCENRTFVLVGNT